MHKIISGATGTGKSQYLMTEYKRLVEEEKVPSDKILVLLMNRSQSLNWRKNNAIAYKKQNITRKTCRTSFCIKTVCFKMGDRTVFTTN